MTVPDEHNDRRARTALTALQWSLAIVILLEAGLFVLAPGSRQEFARTHMPPIIRSVLGWGEIVGAILLLIPRTAVRGACLLIVIFLLAIVVHLAHGMPNVGALVVYSAAAWAVAFGKASRRGTL